MTSMVVGDIPSGALASVESLAAWAALGLVRVNPTLTIIEASGTAPLRLAQSYVVKGDAPSDDRIVLRLSLPLDPAWQESGAKIWTRVTQISSTPLPSAWKVN